MNAGTRTKFATWTDASPVEQAVISGGALTATLLSWGALVQDLRLDGHPSPLVLGFREFAHYPLYSQFFGATAGRYANRIRGGRFEIDGVEYQADTNFFGKHLLHGGANGTYRRNWALVELAPDKAVFRLEDRDGEMGFPGNCELVVGYACRPSGTLAIEMTATTDRPTLVNLAHHSYFNLDGGPDTRDHELRIEASAYLPVDDELIPTGEVRSVVGTDFDFRESRPIRREIDGRQVVYDHNFCVSPQRVAPRPMVTVQSRKSGIRMTVTSGEPGLQFYAGHKISTPVPGLMGAPYGAYGGICLEPQIWPDSPHHPHFPQAILRPGETYRQVTEYAFSRMA